MAEETAGKKKNKWIKIIAIVVVILLIIGVAWWLLKGTGAWKLNAKQSFANGNTPDESQGPGITVAAAQAYAINKGYKAFFRDNGGMVYYWKVAPGALIANLGGDAYTYA
jgi:hypothetical protein